MSEGIPDKHPVLPAVIGELTTADAATHAAVLKAQEQTIPTLDDFLGRLVTLNAALIGGGFVVARGDVMSAGWAVATLVVLFLSLVVALAGLAPSKWAFSRRLVDAAGYDRFERELIARKSWAMCVAGVLLAVAFAVGIGGVTAKIASGQQVDSATPTTR